VVYADPPWGYNNTMPDYFTEQSDHYAVMSVPEIAAMPVKQWVEKDAVLFLWVTSPILEESFEIIKAWGFEYKASFVWDKIRKVMGHYNSVCHELLLVCVRGSCQPDVHKLFDSVVTEERTEHSRKPETFRQIIDTIYPNGRRIELFAREKHEGWVTYGNEV
jgi:N6-adenosine-specific RNA methylase IME4